MGSADSRPQILPRLQRFDHRPNAGNTPITSARGSPASTTGAEPLAVQAARRLAFRVSRARVGKPFTARARPFAHAPGRRTMWGSEAVAHRRLLQNVTKRDLIAVFAGALLLASFAIPAFNGYVERLEGARREQHRHHELAALSLAARCQQTTGQPRRSRARRRRSSCGRPYMYVRAAGARQGQLHAQGRQARPAGLGLSISTAWGPTASRRWRCRPRRRATTWSAPRTARISASPSITD